MARVCSIKCVDENLHSLDRFGVTSKYFVLCPTRQEGKYWQASTQLQIVYVYTYILIECDGEQHLMEIIKLPPIFYVGRCISFCLSDAH